MASRSKVEAVVDPIPPGGGPLEEVPRWPLSGTSPVIVAGDGIEIVVVALAVHDLGHPRSGGPAQAPGPSVRALDALEAARGNRGVRRVAPNVYVFYEKARPASGRR